MRHGFASSPDSKKRQLIMMTSVAWWALIRDKHQLINKCKQPCRCHKGGLTSIAHTLWFVDIVCIDLNVLSKRQEMIVFGGQTRTCSQNTTHHTPHYNDVIMGAIASHITSLTIVSSIVHSGADQRQHQSSASLAFVRGINRGPVTRKMFPFGDVIISQFEWIKNMSFKINKPWVNMIQYDTFYFACNKH